MWRLLCSILACISIGRCLRKADEQAYYLHVLTSRTPLVGSVELRLVKFLNNDTTEKTTCYYVFCKHFYAAWLGVATQTLPLLTMVGGRTRPNGKLDVIRYFPSYFTSRRELLSLSTHAALGDCTHLDNSTLVSGPIATFARVSVTEASDG